MTVTSTAATLLLIVCLWRPSASFSAISPVLSVNQQSLEDWKFPRSWVPIASTYELDPSKPTALQFLGLHYVTYFDGNRWVLLDDACPHRLAPLSEGRVDPSTQHLECSYHGWEFNGDGQCQSIPQTDDKSALANPKCSVHSYPVCDEKNLLWFWPWPDDVLSCHPSNSPEAISEGMALSTTTDDDALVGSTAREGNDEGIEPTKVSASQK